MRDRKAFPSVKGQDDLKEIWGNLRTISCLIPSLKSFFDDIKYLHPSAKVLRQLLPPSKRHSIREGMWRIFTAGNLNNGQWILQTGEGEKQYQYMTGSASDQFEFSYQQLWLYAWRHWPELVPECPRKEEGKDTPMPQKPDPGKRYGIAKLAVKLGFESDEIRQLLLLNPDREIAREALLRARNPDRFHYIDSEFDSYVNKICRLFGLAEEMSVVESKPGLVVPGLGESMERRCGRVFQNAYISDRNHLFLNNFYPAASGTGGGVSSFAVRISVFFAFFGQRLPTDALRTQSDSQPLLRLTEANSEGLSQSHQGETQAQQHAKAPEDSTSKPTIKEPITVTPQLCMSQQGEQSENTTITDIEMKVNRIMFCESVR